MSLIERIIKEKARCCHTPWRPCKECVLYPDELPYDFCASMYKSSEESFFIAEYMTNTDKEIDEHE